MEETEEESSMRFILGVGVFLGSFLVLGLLNLEADSRATIEFLRFVQLYAIPIAGTLLILVGQRASRIRLELAGLCLIPCSLICIAISDSVSTKQARKTFMESIRIVEALNTFKAIQGNYPTDLFELEPIYIAELPRSHMRVFTSPPFYYHLEEDGRFTLMPPASFHEGNRSWLELPSFSR